MPRALVLALTVLALGCDSTGGAPQIVGDGTGDPSDSGDGGGNNGGNGGNGGNAGGTPGGVDDTGGDPFGDDPLLWHGERKVVYTAFGGRKCTLTLVEEGEQLYGPGYLQLEKACVGCERVFGVNLEVKGACITQGWPEAVTRGLDFKAGGEVDVYSMSQSGASWEARLMATGTWDGTTLTYAYKDPDILYKDVSVSGTTTFE